MTYGADDGLVKVRPALDRIPHLKELLKVESEDDFTELRVPKPRVAHWARPSLSLDLKACWAARSPAELLAANRQLKPIAPNS